MAVSMIGPKFYAWDRNGKPLAFGKLYTYQARTNTPKPTYQSEDQVVENTNPVILNGEGYANVYLDGSYKMVLKDSDENEIWSSDPVTSSAPEEWVNCRSATYLSPKVFSVGGNVTEEYEPGRNVRLNSNSVNYDYSTIISSSFSGVNTSIIVADAVVKTGLVGVCASIVGPNSTNVSIVSDSRYSPAFFSESDLLIGKPIGGEAGDVTFVSGDGLKVLGQQDQFYFYTVKETGSAPDLDLGDGLWAKKLSLDPSSYLSSSMKFDSTKSVNAAINDTKFNHSNPLGNKLQVIAHRGMAFQYPENTLVACSSAISLGVDGIELDAAISSDGVAYLFHDTTVDALTDGVGTFTELGSTYIDSLKFTSTAGTILSDERIPRLIDVLIFCRKYGTHVSLELKLIKDNDDIDYIISLINQYNMQHLVSLQSGNLANVQYVRSVDSVINVGYVTGDPAYQAYIDTLASLGNATVNAQHDMIFANQGIVKYARDRGVDIQAYTVNDNIFADRIQKVGVYKIITDRLTGELQR